MADETQTPDAKAKEEASAKAAKEAKEAEALAAKEAEEAEAAAVAADPNAVETVTLKKGDEKIVVNKGSDKAAELKKLGYK